MVVFQIRFARLVPGYVTLICFFIGVVAGVGVRHSAATPPTPKPNVGDFAPLIGPQGQAPLLPQVPIAQAPSEPAANASESSGQSAQEPTTGSEPERLVSENASDASRIAELQETIEEELQRLAELEKTLEAPDSEYNQAEMAFRDLNQQWERQREFQSRAAQEGNRPLVLALQQELDALNKQLQLAQDRFDLAIEERKTAREEYATLRAKLKKDQEALEAITGGDLPQEETPSDAASNMDKSTDGGSPSQTNQADESGTSSQARDREDAKGESNEENQSDKTKEEDKEPEVQDEELMQAQEEAETKEEEAEQAEEETKSLSARMADLQKLIAQQQKELILARKKFDLETETQKTLREELARLQESGGEEAISAMGAIEESEERQLAAKHQINEVNERLNDLRSELGMLQGEHIVALQEAAASRAAAEEAEDRVASLQNPFAPRNVLAWIIDHGPRLFLILCGMFLLNRVASFFAHRSIRLVSSGTGRGNTIERENRAKTLVGVFQNAVTVAVFVSGILMMLEEVGANITVLMGGVAVVGLAVAFGAQNLIKDYFYGFVMLLENQYMLNDSVRIGEVTGQVERITLRMTVLRDSNGVVHFIPNGTINSVSNETHGWSRAVIDFAVGYQEDLNQVNEIVQEISQAMRADPKFKSMILDDATEPAIEKFGDSAVHLKFSMKTTASKQSVIKHELLRQLKQRFDEIGVVPPYPQRVYRSTQGRSDRDLHAA